jgi:hypothetical protein
LGFTALRWDETMNENELWLWEKLWERFPGYALLLEVTKSAAEAEIDTLIREAGHEPVQRGRA